MNYIIFSLLIIYLECFNNEYWETILKLIYLIHSSLPVYLKN